MPPHLNASQRAAVHYLAGPLLVLAGAGSGKTRVITAKIAHLIREGTAADSIAAITFTNKAAREMAERARELLAREGSGGTAKDVVISTFHALGLRIVRGEAKALGLRPGFSVLDPADLELIVAELCATADRARARAAQWKISSWKNALVTPAQALAAAKSQEEVAAARAYTQYADALSAYQAVDFDDLIALPIALFERDAEARLRWRKRFAHVLVDEYQDTNPAQYRLFRELVGTTTPFTVVGDDDQAIYGWRGATLDNLAQLPRDYPRLQVIKLEQNYRSTVRILRSANALIAKNPKLFDKKLWSELGLGETLRVAPAADDEAEAEMVVSRLLSERFSRRARHADFAILYRGNHQARAFETALRARSVPYEISGGTSIFDRTEIRDIVAYLRLVANEDDDPAFVRAATTPRRGIGAATLARLGEIGKARGASLFAAAFEPAFANGVPVRQRESVVEFCALINSLRHRAPREPAGRLLNELVAKIGYEDWLVSTLDKREAVERSQSVRDFAAWLARKGESDGRNLLELTQMVALITQLDDRDAEGTDAVRLSTLHAAKGLEFPHVFIVGVEEGLLPHREAVDAGNVDEERRLMYVGLTRARETLQLSYCRTRKRAGEKVDVTPSRFLGELAQDDLRYADAPLTPDEAANERTAGLERLKSLKSLVARR
ncbi:MAG TPA: UvrD-helicase domain-containing protein [Casimicrobiaceae bacterium]|nr:UvrD-helicase domain-containing protein [Casimicrobiaceae bacterium]